MPPVNESSEEGQGVWLKILEQALAGVGESFQENELAYLCLTSKCEHAIRDRLAFRLHRDLDKQALVAREVEGLVDLVVMSAECVPLCAVELKMGLSCDAMNETRKADFIGTSLASDARKLAKFNEKFSGAETLQLLVLAHPDQPPERAQDPYIGYGNILRQDHVADSEVLVERVKARYGLERPGVWEGGQAFGISVNVHYWLFKSDAKWAPKRGPSNLRRQPRRDGPAV